MSFSESVRGGDTAKTQEKVGRAEESEKSPEQLLVELEAAKEDVNGQLDQLHAAMESVDQSKLDEVDQSLFEKIGAIYNDGKRCIGEFVSEHPRMTAAACLLVSIAAAYLSMKGMDGVKDAVTVLGNGPLGTHSLMLNPGHTALEFHEFQALMVAEGTTFVSAVCSLLALATPESYGVEPNKHKRKAA